MSLLNMRCRRDGFSLVEVVVAVSILSIGLVIVLRHFLSVVATVNSLETQTDAVVFAETKMQELVIARCGEFGDGESGLPVSGAVRLNGRPVKYSWESTDISMGNGTEQAIEQVSLSVKWMQESKEGSVDLTRYFEAGADGG